MLESTCGKCGEAYNPATIEEMHFNRFDGKECNGEPVNTIEYGGGN